MASAFVFGTLAVSATKTRESDPSADADVYQGNIDDFEGVSI